MATNMPGLEPGPGGLPCSPGLFLGSSTSQFTIQAKKTPFRPDEYLFHLYVPQDRFLPARPNPRKTLNQIKSRFHTIGESLSSLLIQEFQSMLAQFIKARSSDHFEMPGSG